MITLLTGAPGAGKSAALVAILDGLSKDRPVFVYNIPEFKLPHVPLEDPRNWPELVPDGAIVVMDEVQDVWRPAGPGQRIAPDIAALETHRHRGLDFYIVTQGPNLVHSNVRALVGRHIHLRDVGFLGRWWYEWPECADNCRTGWRTAPIKKRYKLPKHVFSKYKSASLHVKPLRSFPAMLAVAVVALIATAVLGFRSYQLVSSKFGSGPSTLSAVPGSPSASLSSSSPSAPAPSPAQAYDFTSFIPRVPSSPESAPAYDGVRHVAVMPRVVGGICSPSRCVCYTQQGTDVGMSSDACREWLAHPPFDPYTQPLPGPPAGGPPSSAAAVSAPAQPDVGTVTLSL